MTCPVCFSKPIEIEVARHYMDAPLYTCSYCGLVHTDREKSGAWEEWPENYDPAWPASRARLVYVAEFLKQHNLCNDVFDISMGDEFFIKECALRGAIVNGTNRSFEETQYLGKHEVVCINWTLENTSDPVGMLRWAKEHSKVVCVATSSRILVPFKKPLWAYIDKSPTHLHPNFFSHETLKSTLGQAGLTVSKVNRFIDSDYLVVTAVDGEGWWAGDHPDKVIEFFERWHEDTKCYVQG